MHIAKDSEAQTQNILVVLGLALHSGEEYLSSEHMYRYGYDARPQSCCRSDCWVQEDDRQRRNIRDNAPCRNHEHSVAVSTLFVRLDH